MSSAADRHVTGTRPPGSQSIAIIGIGGRFPGAPSLDRFWHNLRSGVESLDAFTDAEMAEAGVDAAARAHPGRVARGTVLDGADLFDAAFFGYSPREAQIIDPQQRVFLECAWEALEHAGHIADAAGAAVGVYAGSSLNTYLLSQILPDRELMTSVGGYQLMLGNDKDFLCTRVSYKLDLRGPSMAIQTACSTSLVAVEVACRALQRGECDLALAGGVSIGFPQRAGYQYQEGMIFSPDGTCRPFDAAARGTRAGSGAGVVVLKRLEDALADRDTIHAVILGAAVNNDGAMKAGYTAPSVDGQLEAIATAQTLAGVAPRSITYVEAHGTATPLGDPIEIAALTQAFRASTDDVGFCTIGSLKANIGHLDVAAGIAGLIKTVLALTHREIPPLPHFRSPNPQLNLPVSPFRVATAAQTWTPAPGTPLRAGVSSFGIGGTNAHVILEEAPTRAASITHRARHVLVLSARTSAALDAATSELAAHLSAHPELAVADVAYTLQTGRRAFAHRRAVVARDTREATTLLAHPQRPPVVTDVHEGGSRPVAFLFSGQGSQHAGMCAEVYESEPVFRAAFDRCAEGLAPRLHRDLRDLLRNGTDLEIGETRHTQPLLFAVEYALATLWMSWGVEPAAMLGHSIGEYVAAHLAGVMSLDDALMLVAERGRLMQAMPPGDMLAVSLSVAELEPLLPVGVEIAAVNAPALCAASGRPEAVRALARTLADAGVEHRTLHTSHAFHSAMMESALGPFREAVARVQLSAPRRPYISNVTGTWIRPEQATSPDYYVTHLRDAVRFADGIATLTSDPSLVLLEVGPGHALSALARLTLGRDAGARVVSSLPHARETRGDLDALLASVARLWTSGVAIDWTGLHAGEALGRVPLPTYPFERKQHWVASQHRSDAVASTEPAATAPPAIVRQTSVDDWFHTPTWTQAPLPRARRARTAETWLVFGRGDALAAGVVKGLRAQGVEVVSVEPGPAYAAVSGDASTAPRFTVRSAAPEDYETMLRALARDGVHPAGILHLWNAGAAQPGEDPTVPALHAVRALARALVVELPGATLRVVIATTGARRVLRERVAEPARALVDGVMLVLPMEHDGVRVCTVDLDGSVVGDASSGLSTDWTVAATTHLLAELAADDAEPVVAWRAGLRWVRRYLPGRLPDLEHAGLSLRPRGVYLVTGGLGGIGVTLAEWLAKQTSARLLLTARTPLPSRDMWDAWLSASASDDTISRHIHNVRRIEQAGGEVLVVAADAGDRAAMSQAVDLARRTWGEIDGVIHAAGIAGDGLLTMQSQADADAVLAPKVSGTAVLTELLGETPLDFMVLCSSVSAIAGAAGTCAYAAANAYLDAFAISRQCPRHWHAVSIAWDAWRDVGMATTVVVPKAMQAARQAYVDAGIAPPDGAEAFARVVASGFPLQVVSPYDVQHVLDARRRTPAASTPRRHDRELAPEATSAHQPDPVAHADPERDPELRVEERLAAVWADLLGVTPVGVDDNFFDLGGHSLLATRVLARIESQFGVRLPLRTIFESPSVRELAEVVASRVLETAAVAAPGGEREEFEL